jgi:CRISPR-associated protein Cas1
MLKDDLVQARMINEVLYCERLMYLERVQNEFENNYFTVDGNATHRRVDTPTPLPAPDVDRPYEASSIWLSSDELKITAKIDVLKGTNGVVTPIEYKRGAVPLVPEGAYLPERAQVCAQVLILREHGYTVPQGAIYFAASKKHVPIAITDDLVAITKKAAARVRELTAAEQLPPPLIDSPKCNGCSLIGICLPDETNALRDGERKEIRRLYPARDDKLPLHVQKQGARIGLAADCLVVHVQNQKDAEVPLAQTSQVCLHGNVQISTQAVRDLLYRHIPILFFSSGGWYCGRTVTSDSKSASLRLAQYAANPLLVQRLARGVVAAKIKNCRTMLRRNAELPADNRALQDLDTLAARCDDNGLDVAELLGLEGAAAAIYFANLGAMLRKPMSFSFEHRNRRPPRDPVNALLSFAYALLVKDFSIALQVVGLDPLIGFYHRPHHNRPSLALDLMEEFRPIIADSVVLTAINTGVVNKQDFVYVADAAALSSTAKRSFIQAYERRMNQEVTHPEFGYSVSYRRVIEIQCRLLSRHLLGEIDHYPHFLVR